MVCLRVLLISRWRSCRYLPDTVDRSDEKRSVSDLHPTECTTPLYTSEGGPRGCCFSFGVPPFQGMVHEGSCAVQRDAGRVMLDHKGLGPSTGWFFSDHFA